AWARAGRPIAAVETDTGLAFESVATRDSATWFGPGFVEYAVVAPDTWPALRASGIPLRGTWRRAALAWALQSPELRRRGPPRAARAVCHVRDAHAARRGRRAVVGGVRLPERRHLPARATPCLERSGDPLPAGGAPGCRERRDRRHAALSRARFGSGGARLGGGVPPAHSPARRAGAGAAGRAPVSAASLPCRRRRARA